MADNTRDRNNTAADIDVVRDHAGHCWPTCGCPDSQDFDWDGFADAINGDPT